MKKKATAYTLIVLAVQLMALPIVSTIATIGMAVLPGNSRVTFVLAPPVVMAPLGLLAGFLCSRLIRNQPDTAARRYLPVYLPALIAATVWLICLLVSSGNTNSPVWWLFGLKNPAFLFEAAVYGLNGTVPAMVLVEMACYLCFAFGFRLAEMLGKTGIKVTRRLPPQLWFSVPAAVALAAVLALSYGLYHSMIDELMYGKVTVQDGVREESLYDYRPFSKDNRLATLDQPASLQFNEFENMPTLDGATAAYPVYAAFAQAVYSGFADRTNEAAFEKNGLLNSDEYPFNIVKCSKTGGAYERLLAGDVDIIFVAEPSKAHLEKAKELGLDFTLTPLGREAFVFFVNKVNPVDNLALAQVQRMYTGEITNWRDIGGERARVVPYQRPDNSGSQTIMQNRVMKGFDLMTPAEDEMVDGMGGMIRQVAAYQNSRGAIGYTFRYYATTMVGNDRVKLLSIDGVAPTVENIRNGAYPLTVGVYAVTLKSNTKQSVADFLAWMQSAEGQALVEKTGYVGVGETK